MGCGQVADSPRITVEETSDAERAPHVARENNCLEGVPEDAQKKRQAENSYEGVHWPYPPVPDYTARSSIPTEAIFVGNSFMLRAPGMQHTLQCGRKPTKLIT